MNQDELELENEFLQASYVEASRAIEIAELHRKSIQHNHYEWTERIEYANPQWHYRPNGERLNRSISNADEAIRQAKIHKARVLTN